MPWMITEVRVSHSCRPPDFWRRLCDTVLHYQRDASWAAKCLSGVRENRLIPEGHSVPGDESFGTAPLVPASFPHRHRDVLEFLDESGGCGAGLTRCRTAKRILY